jgi:hypothetical protein
MKKVALIGAFMLMSSQAFAWGNSSFEDLGVTIGQAVGGAANGGYGAESRVGAAVGKMAGTVLGRPMDESSEKDKRTNSAIEAAREQAAIDAAYDMERRRLDPNYVPVHRQSTQNGSYSTGSGSSYATGMSATWEKFDRAAQSYNAQNRK